jgi:hypothetical protein
MSGYIDLSTPENKAKWCKYFNCTYHDILDVIIKMGNNPKMVKMMFDIQRSAIASKKTPLQITNPINNF